LDQGRLKRACSFLFQKSIACLPVINMVRTGDEIEAAFPVQLPLPGSSRCCDTDGSSPLWASVSHGIYLSIEAAGIHRSLGVSTSFVLSMTLDHWTPAQLRMMELGGNERWTAFLLEHGIPKDMPIREKYSTRAAAWYRSCLRAEAEGLAPPAPLPPGTGHLSVHAKPSPTLAVLDRVYASVQSASVAKQDDMMKALEAHARAEALRRKTSSSSVPESLCRMFQLIINELLLISDGDETALRLKEMSTGSMEGFCGEKSLAGETSALLSCQADTPRSEVAVC
jgi:hypothetical protein